MRATFHYSASQLRNFASSSAAKSPDFFCFPLVGIGIFIGSQTFSRKGNWVSIGFFSGSGGPLLLLLMDRDTFRASLGNWFIVYDSQFRFLINTTHVVLMKTRRRHRQHFELIGIANFSLNWICWIDSRDINPVLISLSISNKDFCQRIGTG